MSTPDWQSHVLPHGSLVELCPGLWQVTGTLNRNPCPRNMVVWRSPAGELVIHSAICLDDAGMAELEALGTVKYIIVPCPIHRADAAHFAARFPDARVLAPACAHAAAEEVVKVDASCEESLGELGIVVHTPLGLKPFELHYELPLEDGTRALVMTDALFNLGPKPPAGFGGLSLKLLGSVGPLGITRIGRWYVLQDKAEFRAYLNDLASVSELSVLCVAHGEAIIGDVSNALREASARV